MIRNYLDFEKPIAEIEAKIESLRFSDGSKNSREISSLEKKLNGVIEEIFKKLTPMQIVKLARHPDRPHTSDYINGIFVDFDELNGDRHFAKGSTIISGIGKIEKYNVAVIGHQKGRTTKENLEFNFGMPNPEDFRKALRIMKLAEKFHLPVITFIDTPGAFPGITAESNNQSEAIARNIFTMATLKTPIVSIVIGEGGSGGALALSVSDALLMLQYSIYSVISPEGCASILWKSVDKADEAAKALKITAPELLSLGLIDGIITEPKGGAHRNHDLVINSVKSSILLKLEQYRKISIEKLVANRYKKLLSYGS